MRNFVIRIIFVEKDCRLVWFKAHALSDCSKAEICSKGIQSQAHRKAEIEHVFIW